MPTQISGLILAGGLGRRMHGADKGLQIFHGKPLVQHLIEHLAPQVDFLSINANRNLSRYRAFGYPVLPDVIPGFLGPLAGLHAGMLHATTPLLITVPCDAPCLPTNLVARLVAALETDASDLAIVQTPERPEPLFCLARTSLLPNLTSYLTAGGRKVSAWQATLKSSRVQFAADTFANLNTLQELPR